MFLDLILELIKDPRPENVDPDFMKSVSEGITSAVCSRMLSLALLVLEATAGLEEKEELCSQCNCAAINSSLSCFSDARQSLNCKISHTKECPGNFSLFHGASPGCFKTR